MTTARILADSAAPGIVRGKTVRVTAYAFAASEPPKEIQLWNVGDNSTDYGVHRWTPRSVAAVMGRYSGRGNPLLIDVEHLGAAADGEPAPTGGYAHLELRNGAPWLVFDWSAYGVEQIATKQRRFLSPEYDVDLATGEIVALYRVSLVADAGTHHARMLASALGASNQERTKMDIAMILAALRAALAAEDPAVAKESITNLVAELQKSVGDGTPSTADLEAAAGPEKTEMAGAPPVPPPDGGGAPPDADKKKVMTSAPVVAVSPAPAVATQAAAAIQAAAGVATASPSARESSPSVASALAEIENVRRDLLLRDEGARLPEPMRVWASSQPYAVVKGMLDSMPRPEAPTQRVAATRGATQGIAARPGLQGKELEDLERGLGIVRASSLMPHSNDRGELVLPAIPPSEWRRITAAADAAEKGGK